jgi:hypothetical protein
VFLGVEMFYGILLLKISDIRASVLENDILLSVVLSLVHEYPWLSSVAAHDEKPS